MFSLLAVLGMVAVLVLVVPRVSLGQWTDRRHPVHGGGRSGAVGLADRHRGRPAGRMDRDLGALRARDGRLHDVARGLPDARRHLRRCGADDRPEPRLGGGADEPRAEGRHPRGGGRTWTRYERDTKVQNSLLDDPQTSGDLTTLVTGTATFEEMAEFVTYLEPVGP